MENDIMVYDASYIALSEDLKSLMYTADEELVERVKKRHGKLVKHLPEL